MKRSEEEEGRPSDGRVKGAGEEILFSQHTSIICGLPALEHTHTRSHTQRKTQRRIRKESGSAPVVFRKPAAAVTQSNTPTPVTNVFIELQKAVYN